MTIAISGGFRSVPVHSQRAQTSAMRFQLALSETTQAQKDPVRADRGAVGASRLTGPIGSPSTDEPIDYGSYDRMMRLSGEERRAETARLADAISASQGLPAGKYDYTRLSVAQAMIVAPHLAGDLGAPLEAAARLFNLGLQKADGGTRFGDSIDWTAPRNALAETARDRDAAFGFGDMASARLYDLVLVMMRQTSVIDENDAPLFATKTF